ncbi:MAG: anaerobic ribonucleoside-triphosphate reductase activating protein [Rectinema sp.]
MLIGGLQRCSLVDYPGHLCAVIFTQGCNFRCPYCHNPQLVDPARFEAPLDEEKVFNFLRSRIGRLRGVVVSGGEPLLNDDLPEFLDRIGQMGYLVKLDTNGSFPDRLSAIVSAGLVDFIAMDVKAPFGRYGELAGVPVDVGAIQESIRIIRNSGTEYLFRTTLAKPLLDEKDTRLIRSFLGPGAHYRVQPLNPAAEWLRPEAR